MQRVPLAQLSVGNHVNPLFKCLPFTHKLASVSRSNTCSENILPKTENTCGIDDAIEFQGLQSVTTGNVFDRIERDMDSPVKSHSSIQKKSIKKEKKFKPLMRLREKRPTKGSKAAQESNIAYTFTPKKFLSELMNQAEITQEEEKPVKSVEVKENTFTSTKANLSTGCSKINTIDKNVYCLNLIPKNVSKLEISGISVFFEEEEEDSYAFPTNIKTVKFVV